MRRRTEQQMMLREKLGVVKDESLAEEKPSYQSLNKDRIDEIIALEKTIKAYILEAIEIEKAGLKITYKKKEDYTFPEELHQKMQEYPALKIAFEDSKDPFGIKVISSK
jgi:uncharacterized protein YdeI (YjbR/CyaY-like superfamily)